MAKILRYICIIIFSCAAAQMPKVIAAQTHETIKMKYTFEVQGIDNEKNILETFEKNSSLLKNETEGFQYYNQLVHAAEKDVDFLKRVLRANAFYDSNVNYHISQEGDVYKINIQLDLREKYKISKIKVIDDEKNILKLPADFFEIKIEDPGHTSTILKQELDILNHFKNNGYAFAEITPRKVIVDHKTLTMKLKFIIKKGPLVSFGPLKFEGLEDIDKAFITQYLKWKEGEVYNQEKIDQTTMGLLKTNLFKDVKITPVYSQDHEHVDMVINVKEEKQIALGVNAKWQYKLGPALGVSIQHMNLFGKGEILGFRVNYAMIQNQNLNTIKDDKSMIGFNQNVGLEQEFIKSNFIVMDQQLIQNSYLGFTDFPSFQRDGLELSFKLRRNIFLFMSADIGVGGERGNVTSKITSTVTRYNLLSLFSGFQLNLEYDKENTDTKLVLGFNADPSFGSYLNKKAFLLGKMNMVTQWDTFANKTFVMAKWGRFSFSSFDNVQEVTEDKRVYMGGDRSIRGYAFQSIGDQQNNFSVGGIAGLEGGIELRYHVFQDFSLVAFFEGGKLITDKNEYKNLFDINGYQWGYGFGIRYDTMVGPFRFDLALPVTPIGSLSDFWNKLQLYLSFGQAF